MKIILLALLLASMQTFAQEKVAPVNDAIPNDNAEEAPKATSRDFPFRFALGFSQSFVSTMQFEDAYLSGANVYESELELSEALSIEADLRMMEKYKFGILIGLSYDMEKKVTGGTSKINGSTVPTSTSNAATIQATTAHLNLLYQWDAVYALVGGNFAIIKFSPGSTLDSSTKVTSYIGGQLGIGYMLTENFAIELFSRSVSIKLTTSTTPADKKEMPLTNGYLSSIFGSLKYVF